MDKKNSKGLEKLRNEIDEVDRKIIELLNNRARHAMNLGKIKEELKLPIYMPEREKEVLNNVQMHNSGPLSNDAIRRLYERIIDESRRMEREHSETSNNKE